MHISKCIVLLLRVINIYTIVQVPGIFLCTHTVLFSPQKSHFSEKENALERG